MTNATIILNEACNLFEQGLLSGADARAVINGEALPPPLSC